MNPEPEPADHIEATRGVLAGVSIGLFLWGVALGCAAHTIKEHIACL
jgi:hypothetical protein